MTDVKREPERVTTNVRTYNRCCMGHELVDLIDVNVAGSGTYLSF
jgi:hypothetical protein